MSIQLQKDVRTLQRDVRNLSAKLQDVDERLENAIRDPVGRSPITPPPFPKMLRDLGFKPPEVA